MIYRHWAAKPVSLDRSRIYDNRGMRALHKPIGLWFDVDGDWKRWCEGEEYSIENLAVPHLLTFKAEANLLHVSTAEGLDRLTSRYSSVNGNERFHSCYAIDWPRVREKFDGIVIAPYQWKRRLALQWYYTWDCASGCVWNLQAIETFVAESVEATA